MRTEPFALTLYRQVKAGTPVEEVARTTGIPLARVRQRVRAAEAFLSRSGPEPKKLQAA